MIELLSIWAACFFWCVMYMEDNRPSYHEGVFEFYFGISSGHIFRLAIHLIFPPAALIMHWYFIHKEAK